MTVYHPLQLERTPLFPAIAMHDSLPVPPCAPAESHPRALPSPARPTRALPSHPLAAGAVAPRAVDTRQPGDRWVEATPDPENPWHVTVTAWAARAAPTHAAPTRVLVQPLATWVVDAARLTPALAEAFELVVGALVVLPSDR
jgi:hypothetical protein